MRRTSWITRFLMLLTLALPVLAGFGRLVVRPAHLLVDADRPGVDEKMRPDARAVGNDLTRLFLPHHLRVAERIMRSGMLPLWDPAGFGGRPLVGNPQAGLFYPPVWLVWWADSPASLGWLTVAHLVWGAAGLFGLCRALGLDRFPAWVAASCFSLAPYMLAQVYEGHYPHVWAACWYPWAFWAFHRWRDGDSRAGLLLAPIVALAFLTGHPQEAYYLVLALAAWAFWDGWRSLRALALTRRNARISKIDDPSAIQRRGQLADLARRAGAACVLLGLTLGLIAVELLPDAHVQAWTLQSARLTLREASRYHLNPLNLLQLLSPTALGQPADYFGHESYWESVLSIGWTPLVLLVIGAVWSSRRELVRGWGALLIFALLFAAGRRLGVFALLYQLVPGMEHFRVPARALFLASLAASVLAGLGVEALRAVDFSALSRRYWTLAVGITGVLLIAQAAAWILGVGHDTPSLYSVGAGDGHWNRYRELGRVLRASSKLVHSPPFWIVLAGAGVALTWRTLHQRRRIPVTAALGGLAVLELAVHAYTLLPLAAPSRFLGHDPIATMLRHAPGDRPFRIRARDAFYSDLRAVSQGLEKTNINDYFQIQIAADLYENLYDIFGPMRPRTARRNGKDGRHLKALRQAVLDRMNVAYLVTDSPLDETSWPTYASGVWSNHVYAIHRNPGVLPRAYVVPRAVVAPGSSWEARLVEVSGRTAAVMTEDPLAHAVGARQPFTPAEYDASDPDCIRVRVATDAPGLLVIADTWLPGWSATVDGVPTTILCGNHCQRVVPLPHAGRHEVLLTYRPPGLIAGAGITVVTAVVWFAAFGVIMWQRSRRGGCREIGARLVASAHARVLAPRGAGSTGLVPGLTPSRAAS